MADIKRKITLDQVWVIRIVLLDTHEDTMKVQDGHTPHIHATVVQIVAGEAHESQGVGGGRTLLPQESQYRVSVCR